MTETPTGETPSDRIEPVELHDEMQRSYIDYAMSVIVSRALPDVRDGLKPVHRRVLYAMFDGGYRPDRGFSKCSRIVGDVMGQYHPHGDTAIYDTLVRLAQPWVMRAPMVSGQGNFGSPGDDPAAAMRYTECKLAPIAMEMVRDIDQETVDFKANYDGRSQEPTVLPSRIPNLLVNGSAGIAVGMATNIPPHNLREVAEGVQWALKHPGASAAELLEALMERIKGPDFPTHGLIVGTKGIEDMYRTGRGSVTMRAVVNIEEDTKGRMQLVVTELPYQVNPDSLMRKIAELVNSGRLQGIADLRDESSSRVGRRIVIEVRRDAVARVVLNNLYKHTELQSNFSANMLALVDDVPRTLTLDGFILNWVNHQIDVIQRRTRYRLREAEKRAHVLRGLAKALDHLDEVIALIRRSPTVDEAREGLKSLLDIDDIQAGAILDMQLRRLAALERQKIIDDLAKIEAEIAELKAILESEERQRQIISDELAEIVDKYGDDRRTQIIPADGDLSDEDLIPDEEVVVTITRGGYAKRTKTDLYRVQGRGGKGVRGASLRGEDSVQHVFATTSHHWILFFTTAGRVYRAKAYHLPEGGRDARGGHVAGLLSFQPGEEIARVLAIRDYETTPYLVLGTKKGLVKKTRLSDYNSPRQAGVIAINFRDEDDELIGAELVSADDDILLISRKAQSIRFRADDEQLRPMGRATSGVTGMKFRDGDELLSMTVIKAGAEEESDPLYVFTVTDGGYAKKTPIEEYRVQGRGGLGIRAMQITENRGELVGGLVLRDSDDVISVTASGQITRSLVSGVPAKGRGTMGVSFVKFKGDDRVVTIARNNETVPTEDDAATDESGTTSDEGQSSD
ncbi:DNA gyrase subunit A [Aeromicrobium piscarium]|uniref:DNA gyrase subunit A n=1 Tax=Aeromicrobium piscarium TaxID=2590901 RepID=A0A554RNI7_9ACTN|nr:DNA gyrase subunit A [Aeromicrobium piscarium]TSD55669.1 DNA gyrase subunit A [Aeromicrobium piscarium]